MNRPISLSLQLLAISPSKINLFEAPASRIGNLSFQQLLQRLINLSPCENKIFSLKFPSLTSMMPFLYVQCSVYVAIAV